MPIEHVCNCCYSSTVSQFLGLSEKKWLNKMSANYASTSDYPLGEGEIKSWLDSRRVLMKAFAEVPDLKNLNIVFEYVIPGGTPGANNYEACGERRVDVLLLSDNTVLALEFKQASEASEYHMLCGQSQAKRYRRMLHDYHLGSVGMRKRSILVLTHAQNLLKNINGKKVRMCSSDKLAEVMRSTFNSSKPVGELEAWLQSGFVQDPRHGNALMAA